MRRREALEIERRGGKCQQCGYRGPRYHFEWAHIEPVRTDRRIKLLYCTNRAFFREMALVRYLCLFCHAEETVLQRARGWSKVVY